MSRHGRFITSNVFFVIALSSASAAAGEGRNESLVAVGKSLAAIVPSATGRRPPRAVSGSERFGLRRAVDLIFSDASWLERRRIFGRLLDHARTTPAPTEIARSRFVDAVAQAIEAAAKARRDNDANETRRAVVEALAAIGWSYRAVAATEGDQVRLRNAQLRWFYLGVLGVQLANAAGFWIAGQTEHFGLATASAMLGGVLLFGDLMLFAEWHDEIGFAEGAASHLTFVKYPIDRAAVARAVEQFWFDLESRLAQNDEWRAWVRGQSQRPGANQIARDVREYLRHLGGAKSLAPVCSHLLAPGAVNSPFT